MKETFGMILRSLRKSEGLSQAELAQMICSTQKTISNWETEKFNPDLSELIQLAKFFDVSTDYLLGL